MSFYAKMEMLPIYSCQVALYSRRELNIRTTSNFLLALASNYLECRPYLRKYYSSTIMLPSDWIEVAEMYQVDIRFFISSFNLTFKCKNVHFVLAKLYRKFPFRILIVIFREDNIETSIAFRG